MAKAVRKQKAPPPPRPPRPPVVLHHVEEIRTTLRNDTSLRNAHLSGLSNLLAQYGIPLSPALSQEIKAMNPPPSSNDSNELRSLRALMWDMRYLSLRIQYIALLLGLFHQKGILLSPPLVYELYQGGPGGSGPRLP